MKVCVCLVGMVVFLLTRAVMTPPAVSITEGQRSDVEQKEDPEQLPTCLRGGLLLEQLQRKSFSIY